MRGSERPFTRTRGITGPCSALAKLGEFLHAASTYLRYLGIVLGIADDEQEVRALFFGPLEQRVEKLHGARRVGERGQSRQVERGYEQARGDADGFHGIVIFLACAVSVGAVSLEKDGD